MSAPAGQVLVLLQELKKEQKGIPPACSSPYILPNTFFANWHTSSVLIFNYCRYKSAAVKL